MSELHYVIAVDHVVILLPIEYTSRQLNVPAPCIYVSHTALFGTAKSHAL